MKFWLDRRTVDSRTEIPGLAAVAAELGWQGPLVDPDLTPVIGYDLYQPPAYPEPDPAIMAGNLLLQLHCTLSRHRRIAYQAGQISEKSANVTQPSLSQLQPPRLVNCYRGATAGWETVLGNCHYWLTRDTASGGASAPPESVGVGSGFCVLRLTSPYPTPLQVVPRGNSTSRDSSGHPRLDALYSTTGLPLPVSGQLADLIADRKDWAFAAERYTFLCMTLNPIRSGAEARKIASSTARAADLLGH
jgi:hypothetical protein